MNKVYFGDCRESLRQMAAEGIKAQMCVTSPPYYGLRDYGHPGQLGLEETPERYIAAMVEVFRAVRDVLADDGTLWVNIGDSYVTGGMSNPSGKSTLGGGKDRGSAAYSLARKVPPGLKSKDLIGIPWMLAFALRADGWYLRQDIIWHKPNPMPESVTDRCTKSHEYIFLLSKSERYFMNPEGLREPAAAGWNGSEFHTGKTMQHQGNRASKKPRAAGNKSHKFVSEYEASGSEEYRTKAGLLKIADTAYETRNRRSVWTVATEPYAGAHFAVYPPALIEPCIMAGTRAGDIVLDPFFGSGTTGEVALRLGRQYIGCEINKAYEPLQKERTRQSSLILEGA